MSGLTAGTAMAAQDTNAVRPTPKCFQAGPVVQIRFTAFAQRPAPCTLTLFGVTPEKAAERLLWELKLDAGQIAFKDQLQGDVAVLRRMPAENEPSLQPGRVMPVAFVDGLTAAALAAGVASLPLR